MKLSSVTKTIGLCSALGLATYGGITTTNKALRELKDSVSKTASGVAGVVVKEVGGKIVEETGHQAAETLGKKLAEEMIMREFLPPELHYDFRKFKEEK